MPLKASNALIVVAKQPAPGRTKTRLSPPLDPEQACQLYECFLNDTLDLVRQVAQVQPVIAFLPAGSEAYFQQLAPDFELIQQEGSDLGARLDNAISSYLSRGYRRVVIMNSDGPTLPSDIVLVDDRFSTIALAVEQSLSLHLLPTWYDVDDAASLVRLAKEVENGSQEVAQHTRRFIAKHFSDQWMR